MLSDLTSSALPMHERWHEPLWFKDTSNHFWFEPIVYYYDTLLLQWVRVNV